MKKEKNYLLIFFLQVSMVVLVERQIFLSLLP